ncbi:MAG: DUF2070 family protein [Defluviitaleaceae bacterium]|nr:DUF2070 family protein [Defluviitaleaceae bacterium]
MFSFIGDLYKYLFTTQDSPILGIFWVLRAIAVVNGIILAFFNPDTGFFLSLILALVVYGVSAFFLHTIRDLGGSEMGAPFPKRLIFTTLGIVLTLAFVYFCWGPDFTFYAGIIFNPATYAIAYLITSIITYLIAMISPGSLYYKY